MTQPPAQEWKSRREIPDSQVRDAADQFNVARVLLDKEPPGGGVYALVHCTSIAIELYLKCLAAETVHVPQPGPRGVATVHAQAASQSHGLGSLFDAIEPAIQSDLESAFEKAAAATGGLTLRQALVKCEGAFFASRYPFEYGQDFPGIDLPLLRDVADTLAAFIANFQGRESVVW